MNNHQQGQQIKKICSYLGMSILSLWLGIFWTLLPIAQLRAQTTSSAAHEQYKEALAQQQKDNPETNTGTRTNPDYAGDLANGEVVSLEADDPNLSAAAIQDAAVWDIIISILVFIVAAVASLFFVIGCTTQPSAWIMVIGTGIFIIGEITNWINFGVNLSKMNQKIEALTKVTQDGKDLQLASIEEYIKLTKTAKDYTTARLVLMGIATVTWFAGAIVAIIEGVIAKVPVTAAKSDICPGPAAFINNISPDKMIAKLSDFVLPKAHAGTAQDTFKTIGLGAVSIILVAAALGSVKTVLNSAMTNGFIRAAIFAVIGILGIAACVATAEAIETFKKRIDKLEELKTKIEVGVANDTGNTQKESPPNSSMTSNSFNLTGESDALDQQLQGICVQSSLGTNTDIERVDCSKCAGDTCGEAKGALDIATTLPSIQFPGAVLSTAQLSKDGLKDISNGKGLSSSMRELGSGSNIKNKLKTLKDIRAMANNILKKHNLPPAPNMDKEMAGFMKKIKDDAYKAIADLTPEQRAMLKQEMLGGPSSQSDKMKDLNESNIYEKLLASKKTFAPTVSGTTMDMSSAGDGSSLNKSENSKNDIVAGVDNEKYLEGLQVKDQDIVKDESVSIWRVLSNRYQRSAFRYFFNEDVRK